MAKIARYFMVENFDEHPAQFILDTEAGAYGYVYLVDYRDEKSIEENMMKIVNGSCPFAKVPGYYIFVGLQANTSGRRFSIEEANVILRGMAQFFLDYRIGKKPGRYIKNKEQ